MWMERIGPWMDRVWPKDSSLAGPGASENLAMAATYAGRAFADAVTLIVPLLTYVNRSSVLERRLLETGLPESFAAEALRLVGRIVDRNSDWPDPKLRELLERIRKTKSDLSTEPTYRSLDEYLLKHGQ